MADDSLPIGREIDSLLAQAEQALAAVTQDLVAGGPPTAHYRLRDLEGTSAETLSADAGSLRDAQLDVKIELGRTQMHLEDVMRLRKGAVVPLDKLTDEPVDILAGGRLIARGEILVLNDNFCVRVTQLIAGQRAA